MIIAAVWLAFFVGLNPSYAVEPLPLSVTPYDALPGDTIELNGDGLAADARALIWGGGPFVRGTLPFPDRVRRVVVQSHFAYVAMDSLTEEFDVLQVFDLGGPESIKLLGSIEVPKSINALAVSGRYAYVGTSAGFYVVSLANPELPTVVSYMVTDSIVDVFLSGNLAYVAMPALGILVFDVTDKEATRIIGRAATTAKETGESVNPTKIIVSGSYAYVATYLGRNWGGLNIFDISQPDNPVEVGWADRMWDSGFRKIALAGNFIFVPRSGFGLYVIDVLDPVNPVRVPQIDILSAANEIVINNEIAWIANGAAGVAAFDMRQPDLPRRIMNFRLGAPGSFTADVFASGRFLIADSVGPDRNRELLIIDSSSIQPPQERSSLKIPGDARRLAVVDGVAYVATDSEGIQVIDVADPDAPVNIGQVDTSEDVHAIEVVGNLAYVSEKNDTLELIDLSDIRAPVVVSRVQASGGWADIAVDGDFAYMVGTGLQVIDYSIPEQPVLVSENAYFRSRWLWGIEAANGIAYIAEVFGHGETGRVHDAKLYIVDSSDPANLQTIGTVRVPVRVNGFKVSGNYAYLAGDAGINGDSGLFIVDVSQPSTPELVARVNTPGNPQNVSIVDGIAYVADGAGGLAAIDVSDPEKPVLIGSTVPSSSGWMTDVALSRNQVFTVNGDSLSIFPRATAARIASGITGGLKVVVPKDLTRGIHNVTVLNPDGKVYRQPNGLQIGSGDGGAGEPVSVWDQSALPAVPAEADPHAVEVGVKFRATLNGEVRGLRFYKGTGNDGPHIGNLWSSTGERLASARFSNETESGWQQVEFDAPVPIAAGVTYIASYFAPRGHYAVDQHYFIEGGTVAGPIELLQDGEDGGNGVYAYYSESRFPTQSYKSSNYWVDVLFRPTDTAAPVNPYGCPCSLWDDETVPEQLTDFDTNPVEIGMKFSSIADGTIRGIRFYKSELNTGPHVASLWSGDGQLLAQANFDGKGSVGWQEVQFESPVPIRADTQYVASYHTNSGHYSIDPHYFRDSGYRNGPLSAPGSGDEGANGVYAYGPGGFPTESWLDSNYWVDVVFVTEVER